MGGAPSTSSAQDYAVAIRLGGQYHCAGTLVHPRLVITAQHCLTGLIRNDGADIGGCELGQSPLPVDRVTVTTGPDLRSPSRTILASRFLYRAGETSCAMDVAGIVLSEDVRLSSYPILAMDPTTIPRVGEALRQDSWGSTDTMDKDLLPGGPMPSLRQVGRGTVELVGAGSYAFEGGRTELPSGMMVVKGLVPCTGDSGGGLINTRGELVATLFGGKPHSDKTDLHCFASGIAVPLSYHTEWLEKMFQVVGTMPTRVGQVKPAELGADCTQNNECTSNLCLTIGQGRKCSSICVVDHPQGCPSSMSCQLVTDRSDGRGACVATSATPTAPSCSQSGDPRGGVHVAWLSAALVSFVAYGRRLRSRRRHAER